MVLNKQIIILLVLLIFLFSCVEKDSYSCIENVKLTRSYDKPAPDIITIFLSNNLVNNNDKKLRDNKDLEKYYFLNKNDTLDYGNHLRFYNEGKSTRILLFSSNFINEKDTSLIKKKFLNAELLLDFIDGDKLRLSFCTPDVPSMSE